MPAPYSYKTNLAVIVDVENRCIVVSILANKNKSPKKVFSNTPFKEVNFKVFNLNSLRNKSLIPHSFKKHCISEDCTGLITNFGNIGIFELVITRIAINYISKNKKMGQLKLCRYF